jgi:hypothetical protein
MMCAGRYHCSRLPSSGAQSTPAWSREPPVGATAATLSVVETYESLAPLGSQQPGAALVLTLRAELSPIVTLVSNVRYTPNRERSWDALGCSGSRSCSSRRAAQCLLSFENVPFRQDEEQAVLECKHENGCIGEGSAAPLVEPLSNYAVQIDSSQLSGLDADLGRRAPQASRGHRDAGAAHDHQPPGQSFPPILGASETAHPACSRNGTCFATGSPYLKRRRTECLLESEHVTFRRLTFIPTPETACFDRGVAQALVRNDRALPRRRRRKGSSNFGTTLRDEKSIAVEPARNLSFSDAAGAAFHHVFSLAASRLAVGSRGLGMRGRVPEGRRRRTHGRRHAKRRWRSRRDRGFNGWRRRRRQLVWRSDRRIVEWLLQRRSPRGRWQ